MPKKRKQARPNAKQAIFNVLKGYEGLLVTSHSISTQLCESGIFLSRPTVAKWLLAAGCVMSERGIYKVPKQLAEETPDEQRSANQPIPTTATTH